MAERILDMQYAKDVQKAMQDTKLAQLEANAVSACTNKLQSLIHYEALRKRALDTGLDQGTLSKHTSPKGSTAAISEGST